MIDREALLRRLEAVVDPGFAAEFLGRLGDSYFSKEDDETAFDDAVSL